MPSQTDNDPGGAFAPLGVRIFRNVWIASLFSNFGQLVLSVAAAWEMTRITASPSMVALVQTATMLPLMLVAVPAGAIADTFDRRKVAIVGLVFSTLSALLLAAAAYAGAMTPWLLLAFCFLVGSGVALFGPSWQAAIGEQVPARLLPAAVALGTVSYNIARSVGPAIGGLIVLAAGAKAVFALTACLFLPLLFAFVAWRRQHAPSRLPPERFAQAIVSGARFSWHSAGIRTILVRVFIASFAGASASALAPLVARDLLGAGAGVFGLLLGAAGAGAVAGALCVSRARDLASTESVVRISALVTGAALVLLGSVHVLAVAIGAMFVIGASGILSTALLNVTVQLSAPRWVTARALSLFAAALTGGVALGAWSWGALAGAFDVGAALVGSGAVSALSALLGLLLPAPSAPAREFAAVAIETEPEVALAITMRSGPIVIEIDYRVAPEQARDFYAVMTRVQGLRRRNGGFNWSLARDIADPASWTERYECPTWGDYLRMRDRWTDADLELQNAADAFHRGGSAGPRVRRRLHRPFGSVRWRADTPDPKQDTVGMFST
jgi:MFS family permease